MKPMLRKARYYVLSHKFELIALFCIWIFASVIRLYQAIHNPVWLDEILVYCLSSIYSFKSLLLVKHWDSAHPPLLYLFTRFVFLLNNFKFIPIQLLRIPLVVVSSMAVFPLYFLGKKITKNYNAFFLPLWFSVQSFQLLNSYQFRPYGVLQFLLSLALLTFFDDMWSSKRKIVFINVLFLLLFFWDYASVWFFLAFFSYQILFKSEYLLRRSKLLLPFLISITLWMPLFLSRLRTTIGFFRSEQQSLTGLIYGFVSLPYFFSGKEYLVQIVLLVVFIISLFVVIKLKDANNPHTILFISLTIPLFVVTTFSYLISNLLIDHHLIFISIMFLTYPIVLLRHRKVGTVIGVILFIFYSFNYNVSSPFKSNEIRPSFKLSDDRVQNILLIKMSEFPEYPFIYYLLRNGYQPEENNGNKFINAEKMVNFSDEDLITSEINDSVFYPTYNYVLFARQERILHDIEKKRLELLCNNSGEIIHGLKDRDENAIDVFNCQLFR